MYSCAAALYYCALPATANGLSLLFTTEHVCDVPGAMMAGEKIMSTVLIIILFSMKILHVVEIAG